MFLFNVILYCVFTWKAVCVYVSFNTYVGRHAPVLLTTITYIKQDHFLDVDALPQYV